MDVGDKHSHRLRVISPQLPFAYRPPNIREHPKGQSTSVSGPVDGKHSSLLVVAISILGQPGARLCIPRRQPISSPKMVFNYSSHSIWLAVGYADQLPDFWIYIAIALDL